MTRLEKKCIAASAGTHLLLLACLICGAAFWKPRETEDNTPLLEIIPFKTTDELFNGGGKPNAEPPNVRPDAPALPPTQPAATEKPSARPPADPPPPQEKQQEPPPPARPAEQKPSEPEETRTPDKNDEEALLPLPKPSSKKKPSPKASSEVVPKPSKKEVKVNLDLAKRYPADTRAQREKKEREDAARAAEEAAQRLASERTALVQGSVNALSGKLSKGTSVEIPGTGGEAYANYNSVVRSIYDQAWIDPGQGVDDGLSVTANIVIKRDGSVIKAQTFIVRSSGNSALDRSVQRALDRVGFVAPFPESAKDAQRTFRIKFNLRDKRMNG